MFIPSKFFSRDLELKALSRLNASKDKTLSTASGVKFKSLQIDGRVRILVDKMLCWYFISNQAAMDRTHKIFH